MKLLKIKRQKTKVNNLDKKVPDATTLIHINQYNTDKHVEKKLDMLIREYRTSLG